MRKMVLLLLWLSGLGAPAGAQTPALEAVLRSELAFARLADEAGIRTAFLAWLQEDACVFTPRMINAKAQYGPEPGDPGSLLWYPEAMGLAVSGDLAWSFGPWTYAVKKGGAVLVNGHFLSVWRKQAGGPWKVVADIGVSHAAPKEPIDRFMVSNGRVETPLSTVKADDALAALTRLETDLAARWVVQGGVALEANLARDARVLRHRSLPLRTPMEIAKALGADRPGTTWRPSLIQVAASGDLGWACGETGPDDQGLAASFLRIWILESKAWKVLFDVRVPHAAKAQ